MLSISCTDSNIQWIGRWPDLSVNGKPTKAAINCGLRFRFKFSGTSLSINTVVPIVTTSYPMIEYSIDGGTWQTATFNTSSVSLATGLSNVNHTFDCYVKGIDYDSNKWNNPQLMIQEFVIDNGAFISPYPTGNKKRILVLGDSMAEGQRVYGSSPNSYDDGGRQTWANILAGLMNADVWIHSFGGSGFFGTCPYGNVPSTDINYLYKINGIPHSDCLFDAVIIESGNNDKDYANTTAPWGTDSSTFISRYTSLINKIKIDQPTAKIFVMTNFNQWTTERYNDQKTVSSNNNVGLIDMSGLNPSGGSWGGNSNHPDTGHCIDIANYIYSKINSLILTPSISVGVNFSHN